VVTVAGGEFPLAETFDLRGSEPGHGEGFHLCPPFGLLCLGLIHSELWQGHDAGREMSKCLGIVAAGGGAEVVGDGKERFDHRADGEDFHHWLGSFGGADRFALVGLGVADECLVQHVPADRKEGHDFIGFQGGVPLHRAELEIGGLAVLLHAQRIGVGENTLAVHDA
jgi:hypothetical protein